MSLRTAEELFGTLEAIGLEHLMQNVAGEGTIFFKGVLPGGRRVCGSYIHELGCCFYIQREELDPIYPDEIPVVFNLQIELCSFFGAKSKESAPDFEIVKMTLGLAYYALYWGHLI